MFKLTLTLITLAAFKGTFATPIPQNVNGLTGALNDVNGLTGTLSGPPVDVSTGTSRRQAEELQDGYGELLKTLSTRQDDAAGEDYEQDVDQRGLPGVDILSKVPVVGGLLGGATGGSGLLKRQLDLGTLVHDVLVDVPGVVSTVGGAIERPIAGALLQKRQLGGASSLLGDVAGGVIGAAISHMPRQDDEEGEGDENYEIRKRQDSILPVLSGGATGGLLSNLPVGLPGSELPRRQVDALAGIANSIQNGIPVAGPLVGGAADGALPSGVLNERQLGSDLLEGLDEEDL